MILLDKTPIGSKHSPFIVAELSGNHNGSIEHAKKIIKAAKQSGAHAIKLQTYTPQTMTIDCKNEEFLIQGGLWDGKSLWELYEWAHTPYQWHAELFAYAKQLNLSCFSTPFDESALELLESLDCPFYKVASFEMTDLPLIEAIASTHKPMIISTGMAEIEEIELTVQTAKDAGCQDIILLHCISGYPTPLEQSQLRNIQYLQRHFQCLVGLSDHSMGYTAAVGAISLGACLIEKHFTLRREDGGPDAQFSMEPQEFTQMVTQCQAIWEALGSKEFCRGKIEKDNLKFRRSIYAVKDIQKGERFTAQNIRRIRPGYGLNPKYYYALLGTCAKRDISLGSALLQEDLQE